MYLLNTFTCPEIWNEKIREEDGILSGSMNYIASKGYTGNCMVNIERFWTTKAEKGLLLNLYYFPKIKIKRGVVL